jgi:glycosyltransferase involved in cell wall biosynthesis
MRLGIVIPCFNESTNLPSLISECQRISLAFDCQFLLVDNGSTDGSWSILSSYQEIHGVAFLRIGFNQGYGYGVRIGLENLKTDYVGWMHGDLQTNMNVLGEIIPRLSPDSFFKGRRRNRRLQARAISSIMARMVSAILNEKLVDINAQPTIFHRKHLGKLDSSPQDFNFDLHMYYLMRKKKLLEKRIDVVVSPRKKGKSSWNFGMFSQFTMARNVLLYTRSIKGINVDYSPSS